jgi:uncharacterized protein (TIGR02266 family)
MNGSDEKLERYRIVGRLMELIQRMPTDRLAKHLKTLESEAAEKLKLDGDRKDLRINCLISVDYSDSNRFFKDYIQDISSSGVFIKTREKFAVGEKILLSLSISEEASAFRIPAEVVRTSPDGIGVRFKVESQVQEDIIASIVEGVNVKKK